MRPVNGDQLRAIVCEEIGQLLGAPTSDYAAALTELNNAIKARALEDAPLVQYLARRAYRDEWLYSPATSLYPDRRWSPLD